jgi:hypothetical protein
VIGITTIFQGLIVVCVSKAEQVLHRTSTLGNKTTCSGRCVGDKRSLIVSYWKSCAVLNDRGCYIAWNVADNEGRVFCWLVPCTTSAARVASHGSVIGETYYLGRSSMWRNGASTNENEIALGAFSPYGCTLYAGQRSRSINLQRSEGSTAFHVGNCILTSPSTTPVLFVAFLNIVSNRGSDASDDRSAVRPLLSMYCNDTCVVLTALFFSP